ncbi:hypothetical protein K501DRAFT_285027 [Backusella circina FSU 941]|nr:hypothetical protein K501DRAFT_285027 [Backusella circina FSU 941]
MGTAYMGNPNIMPLQANPYQSPIPPYQLVNDSSIPPPSMYQQTPGYPPTPGPSYPYHLMYEDPSCCESLAETFCCCFGYGQPRDPYEENLMREINIRRRMLKEQRKEMQVYKMQQEKHQQLQQQQQQLQQKQQLQQQQMQQQQALQTPEQTAV